MSDAAEPAVDTETDAVAETAAKVREFLAPFEDVTFDEQGACSLLWGSAKVTVGVDVFDEDQSVVRVRADCVTGATPSPELYEWAATHEADLGHWRVEVDGGSATIAIIHGLLGEFLNPAELRMTVVAMAYLADHFDDGLAERFGGTVHDATANRPA